ncbi:MAG: hypothetical protein K2X95_09250 [Flavobacteriaceae bacterium]|nr:hypothetical protein [Flavobacteriaceae bacterium]
MKYLVNIETDNKLYSTRISNAIYSALAELDKEFFEKKQSIVHYKTETHISVKYKNAVSLAEIKPAQETLIQEEKKD